jgi:hypothetical protein
VSAAGREETFCDGFQKLFHQKHGAHLYRQHNQRRYHSRGSEGDERPFIHYDQPKARQSDVYEKQNRNRADYQADQKLPVVFGIVKKEAVYQARQQGAQRKTEEKRAFRKEQCPYHIAQSSDSSAPRRPQQNRGQHYRHVRKTYTQKLRLYRNKTLQNYQNREHKARKNQFIHFGHDNILQNIHAALLLPHE